MIPTPNAAVEYSGAGFFLAGIGVLWRDYWMFRIIKFLCFLAIVLVGFLVPAAAELRYLGNHPIEFALESTILPLWWPLPLITLLVFVLGGLVFAYGKHAFCPWIGLISSAAKNDKLGAARTVAILTTAQKLLLISGLTLCGTRIMFVLVKLDEPIGAIAFGIGMALACLIKAGFISLLFIVPVRAYWENQTLQDDE